MCNFKSARSLGSVRGEEDPIIKEKASLQSTMNMPGRFNRNARQLGEEKVDLLLVAKDVATLVALT